jgi:hypothetical protein
MKSFIHHTLKGKKKKKNQFFVVILTIWLMNNFRLLLKISTHLMSSRGDTQPLQNVQALRLSRIDRVL